MRIGVVTVHKAPNYGANLQAYATWKFITNNGHYCEILDMSLQPEGERFPLSRPEYYQKNKEPFRIRIKLLARKILVLFGVKKPIYIPPLILPSAQRKFNAFNELINYSSTYNTLEALYSQPPQYDVYLTGSDQVWNPNSGRLRDVDLLSFADSKQRISLSASFGVNCISKEDKKKIKKELYKFKSISVREEAGKRIINDVLPRNDVEVLIDPTMLLTADEWDKVAKKPKQLDNLKNKRYILTYFLGNLSMDKKGKIEEIAQKNNCEIINILDKNSPFYQTGPSEFLYLEKNAILICTDSFHSCVFSILYNRPFLVFQREGNVNKMNSRIETLLNKFNLEDREVNENITDDKLKYDYSQAYKILENERDKTKIFIKNALDIK